MKICFVSLYVYPLFNPSMSSPFGGSEVRSWLLGVGLSRLPEHEVCFVVFDHGQKEAEQFGQVKVYRHSYYKSQTGGSPSSLDLSKYLERSPRFPFVRFKGMGWAMLVGLPIALIYRLGAQCIRPIRAGFCGWLKVGDYEIEPRKTRIYEEIDADIYCGFGVSTLTVEIAAFCKRAAKKFVLFAGSDVDFSPNQWAGPLGANPCGSPGDTCYYALAYADLIITQTEMQRSLLAERFGKEGVTLLNPIDLSDRVPYDDERAPSRDIALWIGKSDQIKRPEMLLKLAMAFPKIEFVMVLNCSDPGIFQAVLGDRPPNVRVLDRVPFQEAERLFARAFVLINTSLFEGFPNTFLQAGKYGVPLLSLQVDPGGFIERDSCGIVAKGDFDQFAKGLDRICSDLALRSRFAGNLRRYAQEHHALDEKVEQLNHLLIQMSGHG